MALVYRPVISLVGLFFWTRVDMNNSLRFALLAILATTATSASAQTAPAANPAVTPAQPSFQSAPQTQTAPAGQAPATGQPTPAQIQAFNQAAQQQQQQQAQQAATNVYANPAAGATVAPVQYAPATAQIPQQAPVAAPTQLPPLPQATPYEQFTGQYFPSSPGEIRNLRGVVDRTQAAVAAPAKPAKPKTGSISVSLSPGSQPPVVRAYYGNTSSIVVVDSSGAPWPVENFRIGNGTAFALNRMDGPQGSSFALDATVPHAQSNLLLQLSGMKSPVVLELVAGQAEYDARLEIRIQGRGPNAQTPVGASLPSAVDGRLLSVLDGVAPPNSKALNVSGFGSAQAWMLPNGRMLVRTDVKVVSPAPTNFVRSADGTNVYEFMPTSELMGMSNGEFVELQIRGW